MKRWLWIAALMVIANMTQSTHAQPSPKGGPNPFDLGPGAQGATLKVPGAGSSPALPANLQNLYKDQLPNTPMTFPTRTAREPEAPKFNQVDINKDITITPQVGPWTILVMSYTTPRDNPNLDAAKMAREFVNEWNSNPAYAKFKLKAHVYNYGSEEKRKEHERVQKLAREQLEALQLKGVSGGKVMPIRVHTVHVDEHTSVLLGGFRDSDSAYAVAKKIREIKPDADFPKRVKVDRLLAAAYEADSRERNGSVKAQVDRFVNPFTKAFPVRNPSIKEGVQQTDVTEEMKLLRHFNRGEEFCLLQCKKPFTLAIKQFNAAQKTMAEKKDAEGFINRFSKGLFGVEGKDREYVDQTAHNAHNLAAALRKSGIEAYVLHCQYCSYVTVGSYSNLQDPQLVQMSRVLENHLRSPSFQFLDLYPRPIPMPVPGIAAN